jgi:hypothetical protein
VVVEQPVDFLRLTAFMRMTCVLGAARADRAASHLQTAPAWLRKVRQPSTRFANRWAGGYFHQSQPGILVMNDQTRCAGPGRRYGFLLKLAARYAGSRVT